MPIASGPGGLYQATIFTEPCEGGFKATVLRVVLLTTRSPVGTEVAHDRFPDHFAKSKEKLNGLQKRISSGGQNFNLLG